jgi:predicted DNA-binding transcriptional regulator YafY
MPTRAVTKAARLHQLETLLESGSWSAAALAKHFRVGKRTIQRDLHELEELGRHLEPRGRRYSLRPRGTALNAVEALAVHSATRLLVHHTRINDRHYRSALTKLAASLPDPARRYLLESVDGIETLSSDGGRTLELVAQAWFEGRVLRFDYAAPIGSGRPHPNELEVYFFEINPINLAPYVIGHERTFFQQVRTFRLDRIANPRVLSEHYTIPDSFDPHEFLASAWGIVAGPRLEVTLRVHGRVAHRIHDRPHRNLRVDATTDDGDLLVTITSGQDKHGIPIDLLPWLLGWGAGIEVLGPQQVRDAVEKELRAAASAYDEPDTGRVT